LLFVFSLDGKKKVIPFCLSYVNLAGNHVQCEISENNSSFSFFFSQKKNNIMGLDLFCGEMYVRAGSYSSVMVQHVAILRAYLVHLRESDPIGATDAMDKALQHVENCRTARKIEACLRGDTDYDEHSLRMLSRHLHPGLVHLVLGCRSKGSWTPYEAREVLLCLKTLRPYFSHVPALDVNDKGEYYLEAILQCAVRNGENVCFL